jgi:hypothetical protein
MTSDRARGVISAVVDSARLVSGLGVLVFALSLAACSTTEKSKIETAPALVAQTEEVPAATKAPAPETTEVKEAVRRVFKDSVEIDSRRTPVFIDGDFNGDSYRDLAVVIKPAPNKLADLNEEFPTWILKDPFSGDETRIPRLRVAADNTLLAVIHGYGPNGWRDPQATQTFLLKNAVGSGMAANQPKDLAKTNEAKKTPYLRGDVISQVVDGTSGYLYFEGATYSWYDPNTFHPETKTGMAHLRKKNK